MEHPVEKVQEIDNSFYDEYGERWYTAFDDPIALLRAENRVKFPWILKELHIHSHLGASILDVGCGGGFLSNELARNGYQVTGVDLSAESLRVAKAHDETNTVKYQIADAYQLPFPDKSFDVLTAMDFLEHVDRPDLVIKEFSRVLKPKGLFFFHTFNRNPLAWLVVIKLLEWFVKNTPKNMHVIHLFIKPRELKEYCKGAGIEIYELKGVRPILSSITWKMIRTGVISELMRFKITNSTLMSYIGVGKKQ
jgi:2-polyprenyl-6-hydroxyphenyl methylase / 3-demethylubiquinone-9 3-methyltransferase